MKLRDWSAAWAYLPELVSLCGAADIGTLAAVLADRQQRGRPAPSEITSPSEWYIHISWPDERVSINAGRVFVHPIKGAA